MTKQITISAELAQWVVDQQRKMTAILEDGKRADWYEADDIARRVADEAAVEFEKALEAPSVAKASECIDPKGNVVLMTFANPVNGRMDALVFRGGAISPFVYAYDYDAETGEWSQGRYFSDTARAYFAANPEIIEESAVWWQTADLARALKEAGLAATPGNIADLMLEVRSMKGWRDRAIEDGNEHLDDAVNFIPAWEK